MRKTVINYYVDLAIGAAFALCAVSGLVFLIPIAWLGADTTRALGIAYRTWDTLHTISSLAMMAGVAAHLALHAHWIVTMARRSRRAPTMRRPVAPTTHFAAEEN